MTDFEARVRRLSAAAWALRAAAPVRADLPPFALAMFTDDRRGGDVAEMVAALPRVPRVPPLAVIFRHDGMVGPARMKLAEEVRLEAKSRGHFFLMARQQLVGADGTHAVSGKGLISWPVHSLVEAAAAKAQGAGLGFVSPIFPTQSHPGAAGLGVARASAIAARAGFPCFALGGMTPETARRLHGLPFYGLGAIGAFSASSG